MRKNRFTFWFLSASFISVLFGSLWLTGDISIFKNISFLIILFSGYLTLQNIFTLTWMLYGWSNPENEQKISSPKDLFSPNLFFTILVPARHEEKVIKDTIRSIENIDYPKSLFEILILCKSDDTKTIKVVNETISGNPNSNVRLVVFESELTNKPIALNLGIKEAKGTIIGVYDAEDEASRKILKIVNTIIIKENVDIVQSGVALMNHNSYWFSPFNVLEYYFWFKSGLHFFSRVGKVAPLGGNTVFIKKQFLEKIGGWDENCLTEDADIGIRLAVIGAKIRVTYDDTCLTKEETPSTIKSFIKQRTRWMQGFLQIFFKGDWLDLPLLRQKLVCLYVLLSPIAQSILIFYIPLGIFISTTKSLSLPLTMLSYMPFYLMAIQLSIYIIGIYKFAKSHHKEFSLGVVLKLIIYYYPYQILLAYSSFRAILRQLTGQKLWEKTRHLNVHRAYEKNY